MDETTRRWMLFMVVVLLIWNVFYFMPETKRRQEAARRQAEAQSTAPDERPAEAVRADVAVASPEEEMAGPEEDLAQGEEIEVITDVYRVTFTTAGAYPLRWQIIDPEYAKATQSDVDDAEELGRTGLQVGDDLPVEIIPQYEGLDSTREYPLMVMLKESGGDYFRGFNERVYHVDRRRDADGSQVITFTSPYTREGLRLVKTYRFHPEKYLVGLHVRLENPLQPNAQTIAFTDALQPGLGLLWGPGLGTAQTAGMRAEANYSVAARDGGQIQSARPKWQRARIGEPVDEVFTGSFRWGAVESRYYVAAIINSADERSPLVRAAVRYQNVPRSEEARRNMAPPYTAEVFSQPFTLQPGASKVLDYHLYVGPKQHTQLSALDEQFGYGLRGIIFHRSTRLIRLLADFMLMLLTWLYGLTNNYGVAIILLVLIMRLITQPLTHISMKHQARVMAEQKRVKPLIDAIKEKYKSDPQKMNAEVWKVYREHGVNPFGMFKGCIWMLIQLPIFFALYRLLMSSIDLRGASFLWINDLTAQDALFTMPFALPFLGNKFNLIPILMGVSQVFAQRLQSSNIEDPTQKQMATIMPIMFIFLFYKFPAGLSLYWFISNLWQIAFQVFVNKKVREEAERKAAESHKARQEVITVSAKKPDEPRKPGFVERLTAALEQKAKEAEQKKRQK